MIKHHIIALKLLLLTWLLLGIAYPLAITGLALVGFPSQANGSLIPHRGLVIGSRLIGQAFTRPEYFHPRPSCAGQGYDAGASGGSNFGPTSRLLLAGVTARLKQVKAGNPELSRTSVPVDMVTASASGLDPDISPASALAQVSRVAQARGISSGELTSCVETHIAGRELGFLGEPRVNVLELNLALDAIKGAKP